MRDDGVRLAVLHVGNEADPQESFSIAASYIPCDSGMAGSTTRNVGKSLIFRDISPSLCLVIARSFPFSTPVARKVMNWRAVIRRQPPCGRTRNRSILPSNRQFAGVLGHFPAHCPHPVAGGASGNPELHARCRGRFAARGGRVVESSCGHGGHLPEKSRPERAVADPDLIGQCCCPNAADNFTLAGCAQGAILRPGDILLRHTAATRHFRAFRPDFPT